MLFPLSTRLRGELSGSGERCPVVRLGWCLAFGLNPKAVDHSSAGSHGEMVGPPSSLLEIAVFVPCPAERGLARSDGAVWFWVATPFPMTTDLNTTSWPTRVHVLDEEAFLPASNAFRTPLGVVPVHAADTRVVSGSLSHCYVTRITFRLRRGPRCRLRFAPGVLRVHGRWTRGRRAVRRSNHCAKRGSAAGPRGGRPRGLVGVPSTPGGRPPR